MLRKKSAAKKQGQAGVTTTGDVTAAENEPATVETFNNDSSKPNGVLKKPNKSTTNAAKPEPTKSKKLSAIDAAAQVLAGSKTAMNTKQMVEAMAAEGLWSSPGGKTPHATLYSAILREIKAKGNNSRFKKTERGQFTTIG